MKLELGVAFVNYNYAYQNKKYSTTNWPIQIKTKLLTNSTTNDIIGVIDNKLNMCINNKMAFAQS